MWLWQKVYILYDRKSRFLLPCETETELLLNHNMGNRHVGCRERFKALQLAKQISTLVLMALQLHNIILYSDAHQ